MTGIQENMIEVFNNTVHWNSTHSNNYVSDGTNLRPIILACILVPYNAAIRVFYSCRKIPYSVKMGITQILTMCSLSYVWWTMSTLSVYVDTNSYRIFFRISQCLLVACRSATILTTTGMGVDRLTSLLYPIYYYQLFSHDRIRRYILGNYVFCSIAACTWFVGDIHTISFFYNNDYSYTLAAIWTNTILCTVFALTTVIVYSIAGYIALKKSRATMCIQGLQGKSDYTNFLRLITKSFVLVVMYITGVLPWLILTFFIVALQGEVFHLYNFKNIVLAFLFLFLASQPFIFIASFHESRQRFLSLLCFWNRQYKERLAAKCNEHYAQYTIHTIELNSKKTNGSKEEKTSSDW